MYWLGVVTLEGFDAERSDARQARWRPTADIYAWKPSSRQIEGEKPGRVVTLEGFEPSIFALKGRRANRCTTGSLRERQR